MFSFFHRTPQPYNQGYLPTENGHDVFFHEFGNKNGIPVLRFHGGPGGQSKVKQATAYPLKKCRVILFDQRGCGLSRPAGETAFNNTDLILHDAVRLLDHLGVKKAIIHGGSWGATLALAFAQKFPDRVEKLILSQTFLAREKDVRWITQDIARCYPDIMERLTSDIKDNKSMRRHYADMMASNNNEQQQKAAILYGRYEYMVGSLSPAFGDEPPDEASINAFKIYMHYDAMDYGLDENQLLNNMERIEHIPALIVHNRLDLVCPVDQSWEVAKKLKNAKLVIVPDAGHGSDMLSKTLAAEIKAFLGC